MELVKVVAKTSFVSQSVGSVNRKQELNISKALADHFIGLNLVELPKKSEADTTPTTPEADVTPTTSEAEAPASETIAGQDEQSASLQAETASQTTTLEQPKKGRGRPAGKQS